MRHSREGKAFCFPCCWKGKWVLDFWFIFVWLKKKIYICDLPDARSNYSFRFFETQLWLVTWIREAKRGLIFTSSCSSCLFGVFSLHYAKRASQSSSVTPCTVRNHVARWRNSLSRFSTNRRKYHRKALGVGNHAEGAGGTDVSLWGESSTPGTSTPINAACYKSLCQTELFRFARSESNSSSHWRREILLPSATLSILLKEFCWKLSPGRARVRNSISTRYGLALLVIIVEWQKGSTVTTLENKKVFL